MKNNQVESRPANSALRKNIFKCLKENPKGTYIQQMARSADVHRNTMRKHLQSLLKEGSIRVWEITKTRKLWFRNV